MRHALTVALQSFEGGLIVVSHDRHLIKAVADSLWLVADGRLSNFDGDLDDYQQWLKARGKLKQSDADGKRDRRDPARQAAPARPAAAVLRRRIAPLRREFDELERRIAALAAERTALEAAFGEGGFTPGEQIDKYTELARELGTLEERWVEIGSAIEAAEAEHAG